MKLIFDFDDILCDTKGYKEQLFICLENAGVSREISEQEYKKTRSTGNTFLLNEFLSHVLKINNLGQDKVESLYEEILDATSNLINKDLVDIAKNLGKENCYIVTQGDDKYQKEKIEKSGIAHMFQEIHTTPSNKKEIVENICERHKNEKVIFIDDKAHHFENLDTKKYPNLITVLYDEQGLEKLKSILSSL